MILGPAHNIDKSLKATLSLLSTGSFFSGLTMRVADPLLPYFSRNFQVGLPEAGQSVTLFTLAYALSLCFVGTLGDRYGKLRVIAVSCMLCAATNALCAAAQAFDLFKLGRLLTGATSSAIMTLAMAWLGDVVDYEKRHAMLSRLLIGMSLGVSAGIFIGGLAADDLINWRIVFAGLATGFLCVGFGVWHLHARLPGHAQQAASTGWRGVLAPFADLKALLKLDPMRFMLAFVTVEGGFYFGALVFIPSHLHATHSVPMSIAGSVGMLAGVGSLFFSLLASAFLPLGERRMLGLGGVVVSVAILVVAMAPMFMALPACFLAGSAFYMLHSTLQVQATQIAPERRGATMAFFSSFFFTGQAIGVFSAGWLTQHFGTTVTLAFQAFGLLAVTSLLLLRPAAVAR